MAICGPSGVGKSTLLGKLGADFSEKFIFSISYTTRDPREGETDGREYYFISNAAFEQKIAENDMIEYACIHGNYYGTSKSKISEAAAASKL